jgi:hypothetical protein
MSEVMEVVVGVGRAECDGVWVPRGVAGAVAPVVAPVVATTVGPDVQPLAGAGFVVNVLLALGVTVGAPVTRSLGSTVRVGEAPLVGFVPLPP